MYICLVRFLSVFYRLYQQFFVYFQISSSLPLQIAYAVDEFSTAGCNSHAAAPDLSTEAEIFFSDIYHDATISQIQITDPTPPPTHQPIITTSNEPFLIPPYSAEPSTSNGHRSKTAASGIVKKYSNRAAVRRYSAFSSASQKLAPMPNSYENVLAKAQPKVNGKISCPVEKCDCVFSKPNNLAMHIKRVHTGTAKVGLNNFFGVFMRLAEICIICQK